MQELPAQHGGYESRPIPLLPSGDPGAGLEPLGVPVSRITGILRRHFWIVALTVFVGVGGAMLVVRQMPKQFAAQASILIEPQHTQVSDLQAISPDSADVSGLVRTQIDVMQSPTIMAKVVRALDLTDVPEFSPHDGLIQRVQNAVLRWMHREPPVWTPNEEQRVAIAAAILGGKISFGNEVRSSVLNVLATTEDPLLSARIANELANQFLDFKRNEKFQAMQRAHDWFQEQLGKLADQMNAADLAVHKYRQEHGLQDQPLDGSNGGPMQTVNRQQLDALTAQLATVSRDRALKEAQLSQAQSVARGQASPESLPAVLSSPVIGTLMSQLSTASARSAELGSTQGASNPELLAARAQERQVRARLQQAMGSVVSSLGTEVQAARGQETLLRQQIEQLRQAVGGESSAEIGLRAPETIARATRSIYERFLTRATELANVAGIQEPDAALVSRAQPPLGPSAPRMTRLLSVAGILSLVLGIALACMIERLRTGFTLPEQLERTLALPLIALVPKVSRSILRGHGSGRPSLAFAASFDKLRGRLRAMGESRPRVVMVTSALPQEGKSMMAAGLARNAALAGWRVMLIECDLNCTSLARHFGVRPEPGLCEILSGRMLGQDSDVVHEPLPGLHLVTGGRLNADSQEMLASSQMKAMLATARDHYDLVILDTPPVLPVADALVLAREADATVFVVRWERTQRDAARDALHLLRNSGARVLGAVMTRVNPRTAAISSNRMFYAFADYKR
jgi:polysaccharide biosynthesis transport protein